jgi:hypothetical protein
MKKIHKMFLYLLLGFAISAQSGSLMAGGNISCLRRAKVYAMDQLTPEDMLGILYCETPEQFEQNLNRIKIEDFYRAICNHFNGEPPLIYLITHQKHDLAITLLEKASDRCSSTEFVNLIYNRHPQGPNVLFWVLVEKNLNLQKKLVLIEAIMNYLPVQFKAKLIQNCFREAVNYSAIELAKKEIKVTSEKERTNKTKIITFLQAELESCQQFGCTQSQPAPSGRLQRLAKKVISGQRRQRAAAKGRQR